MFEKRRSHGGERLVVIAVGAEVSPHIIRCRGMTGDFDGFWIAGRCWPV